MPFKIFLSRSAEKQLGSFPEQIQDKIKENLNVLKDNPERKRAKADIRPLVNVQEYWRLRIGDYRVYYRIKNSSAEVCVDIIIHKNHAEKEIARLRKKVAGKKKKDTEHSKKRAVKS